MERIALNELKKLDITVTLDELAVLIYAKVKEYRRLRKLTQQ